MHPGDEDRLAALLDGADLTSARAALARAAGDELSRLAYLVLQLRPAAEAAAAAAIAAAVRRAEATNWRPTGRELRERLLADVIGEGLRRYDGTHEVDPLAGARPSLLPADPASRAVVVAVVMADLPLPAAARASGMRAARARRIVRDAVTAAGSEDRLRRGMAAQLAPVSPGIPHQAVNAAADAPGSDRRREALPQAALVGATLAVLLVILVTGSPRPPAGERAAESRPPTLRVTAPPAAAVAAEGLPTLEECGIGPPSAALAFAGWLTVDELGAAPPDAAGNQLFYALVPAGDVAWNPPGLSRRIMPPVRGRLACLSTVTGGPPTVVGLPAAWTPPAGVARPPRVTLADCRIGPAHARLAHRGWLLAAHLDGEPSPRPLYALVTADEVSWAEPTSVTSSPSRERQGRVACVLDPQSGEVRTVAVPGSWSPPPLVDGCPASPLQRFAGNLELGGPHAFVLLPPVSTSWWADDPSVKIMARLSPGPPAGSSVTAAARPLGAGTPQPLRVDHAPTPAGRAPSETHYMWLEGLVFTEPGCWVVSVAIDGTDVGWAIVPVSARAN